MNNVNNIVAKSILTDLATMAMEVYQSPKSRE